MLIKIKKSWELPESAATDESLYINRRQVLKTMAVGSFALGSIGLLAGCEEGPTPEAQAAKPEPDPSAGLYPVERNDRYTIKRPLTSEELATTYNNYYEFGSSKNIWQAAQALKIRPWTVKISGMVEEPMEIDIDDLLAKMPLEERLYRHRCVERWSMTVPWSGFPLRAFVEMARPLSSAKYLKMTTFEDPQMAPGQKASWYPWPYVEGLTIPEATNELSFIATGLYGKPIPRQNGAPLRLVAPWKYGFKSVKSIVNFEFTDQQPVSFWQTILGNEYGFWANVNPEVPHPRWSQAYERPLGTDETVPTQIYNGYGEYVADLYKDLVDKEEIFM
ncbi:MAG: protein-methionine-sulfoxide reductase catalytic subunit MsrP [Pseudomonadota bacterium]